MKSGLYLRKSSNGLSNPSWARSAMSILFPINYYLIDNRISLSFLKNLELSDQISFFKSSGSEKSGYLDIPVELGLCYYYSRKRKLGKSDLDIRLEYFPAIKVIESIDNNIFSLIRDIDIKDISGLKWSLNYTLDGIMLGFIDNSYILDEVGLYTSCINLLSSLPTE